jgi:DEAD/DEAH box helicase domain-containing protein
MEPQQCPKCEVDLTDIVKTSEGPVFIYYHGLCPKCYDTVEIKGVKEIKPMEITPDSKVVDVMPDILRMLPFPSFNPDINEGSYVVYDVETLRGPKEVEGGWRNPAGMGFGTAIMYDSLVDQYFFYDQNQDDILKDALCDRRVVGFNSVRFDNSIMLGNDYEVAPWEDYDILLAAIQVKFQVGSYEEAVEKHGQWALHDGSLSLDSICKATLGIGKTGHGAHAPVLIRDEKWAEVYAYNLQDVRLTRKLFEFIRTYGFLIDGKSNKIEIYF